MFLRENTSQDFQIIALIYSDPLLIIIAQIHINE